LGPRGIRLLPTGNSRGAKRPRRPIGRWHGRHRRISKSHATKDLTAWFGEASVPLLSCEVRKARGPERHKGVDDRKVVLRVPGSW